MSAAVAFRTHSEVFDRGSHGGHVNVSISQLLDWSRSNSYKHHTLAPIRTEAPKADLVRDSGSPLDRIGLSGYSAAPVQPSGILSTIAWIRDPLFAEATPNMRPGLLRELATTLQVETDRLSGTKLARKRRRIFDGIGALSNSAPMKDEDALDLFSSLAYMCNVQLVFVQLADSVEGSGAGAGAGTATAPELHHLSFSSDPRNWSTETPTWIVDAHGRWIAQPPSTSRDGDVVRRLSAWLSDLEDTKKWTIGWPDAEGTKAELVDALMDSPTWQPAHAKFLKDVLAKQLGRWKSIQHLLELSRSVAA